jgi:hypothetical protein
VAASFPRDEYLRFQNEFMFQVPMQEMLQSKVIVIVFTENSMCLPKRADPLCGSINENTRDFRGIS